MGVDIEGLDSTFEELNDLEDDWGNESPEWIVGTPAEYAIYLEFGTDSYTIQSDDAEALRFEVEGDIVIVSEVNHPGIDPMPFFRPAVAEVRTRGAADFIDEHTQRSVESLQSARDLVATLGFALENRIKEIITRKGLIDTGNLRSSVQAVPIEDIDQLRE